MIVVAGIFAAALARVAVGMGLVSRWYVYPPVVLALAYYTFGPTLETPIFALLAALNVGLGFTNWEDRLHQACRYAFLPLLGAIAYLIAERHLGFVVWPALCAAVGWAEPAIRQHLAQFKFTVFGREVSSAQYAEFVIGAVCLGGFAPVALIVQATTSIEG